MSPQCKVCGSTTIPNPRKTAENPTWPDFLCNQDNGKCGQDNTVTNARGTKTFFNATPAWKPRAGSTGAVPATTIAKAAPPTHTHQVDAAFAAAKQADAEFVASMPDYLKSEKIFDPEQEVWERKDRTSIAQTSLNCASTVYQGRDVDAGKLTAYAEQLYTWITTKRQ